MPDTLRGRILPSLIALATLAGCGSQAKPPAPGENRGVPPDLRGSRVILLPVQQVVGLAGDPDAELAFTLTDRGQEIDWILEDEVSRVLDRSPAMDTRTRGLPVGAFLAAEVNRVGDPLYGELRRMAALVDADAILIPVQASYQPDETLPGSAPRVRFTATLVEPRTGRVLWFGIEQGGEFERTDPRALATAVESLAKTLLWYVSPGR